MSMRTQNGLPTKLWGFAFMALLIALWAVLSAMELLSPSHFPSPGQVVMVLAQEKGQLLNQALISLTRTLAAFVIGGGLGLGLGLLQGVFPKFRDTTELLIEGLRPIPSVALIPLGILFVGMNFRLNIALAAYACSWPALISAYDGVKSVNPMLIDTARTMGFSRRRILSEVILPAALPMAATGLRIGLAIAFAVEISVEMIVPKQGLGALATNAALSGLTPLLYAAIVTAGVVGLVSNSLFRRLEHLFLRRYGPQWSSAS